MKKPAVITTLSWTWLKRRTTQWNHIILVQVSNHIAQQLNRLKRININLNLYFNLNMWNVICDILGQDNVQSISHVSSLFTQAPSHLQRPVAQPCCTCTSWCMTHPHCRRIELWAGFAAVLEGSPEKHLRQPPTTAVLMPAPVLEVRDVQMDWRSLTPDPVGLACVCADTVLPGLVARCPETSFHWWRVQV